MPLYAEAAIALTVGLTRDEIRTARDRNLEKNVDWQMHGRQVVWTQAGLNNAIDLDLVPSADYAIAIVDEKKLPGVPDLQELQVKRVYPNPRLLLATLPNGDEVRVQVKTNLNFRPRMMIKARCVEGTLYQLVGRCPRYPGRY